MPEQARPSRIWPIASLAAAGCLWGTGFLFGKITFAEMTVSENVGYRFIFGSLGLAPTLWRRPPTGLGRRALGLILVASIVGVPIQFLLQYKGLEATTVSHASLIVGTLPILVALFWVDGGFRWWGRIDRDRQESRRGSSGHNKR